MYIYRASIWPEITYTLSSLTEEDLKNIGECLFESGGSAEQAMGSYILNNLEAYREQN